MKDIKNIIDIVTDMIDNRLYDDNLDKGENLNDKIKLYSDELQEDIKLVFFILKNNKKTVDVDRLDGIEWNYGVITRDFIKYNREKQLNKICQ